MAQKYLSPQPSCPSPSLSQTPPFPWYIPDCWKVLTTIKLLSFLYYLTNHCKFGRNVESDLQDGGCFHLEFWNNCCYFFITSPIFTKFSGNIVTFIKNTSMMSIMQIWLKYKMNVATILDFATLLLIIYYLTNLHHIWWKCWYIR